MEEKKVFEIPEIATYDREELDLETVITGEPSPMNESNRRLKENFLVVDTVHVLNRFLRL